MPAKYLTCDAVEFCCICIYGHFLALLMMQIMGYRSYAEYTLKPNMASSPEVVMSFLKEMSEMVRPSADEVLCP